MKIGIIGSGWYGCHLAYVLSKYGHIVTIFEKEQTIFSGASSQNTNRLHRGYHYPRSKVTRMENMECIEKFIDRYPQFVYGKANNIYGVSQQDSILDWETYKDILRSSNLKYKEIDAEKYGFKNLQGALICDEYFIDFVKAKSFFENKLKTNIHYNTPVHSLHETADEIVVNKKYHFDLIVDCSYSFFLKTESLKIKYELIQLPILKGINNNRELSFVIMDGHFQSLTPYVLSENHFTLYDVEFSSLLKSNDISDIINSPMSKEQTLMFEKEMMEKANYYYHNFSKVYEIVGKISTIRATHDNLDANRKIVCEKESKIIKIFSGKIGSIFQAESLLLNLL